MPAHAAVPVPGQVRQTSGGAGHFDHDPIPVQSVEGITKVGATEGGDAEEPSVGTEAGNEGRLFIEVVDPVAHVSSIDRGPPRSSIVGSSGGNAHGHIGSDRFDLVGFHDAPEMDEAGAAEKVSDLVIAVVERE